MSNYLKKILAKTMEWNLPKTNKRKICSSSTLESSIKTDREIVLKKEEKIPEMTERLENLKAEVRGITKRWQIREKIDKLDMIKSLEDEIEKITNFSYLDDFEKKVKPYIFSEASTTFRKKTKYKEGEIDGHVVQNDDCKSTVFKEYMSAINGKSPEVVLHKEDICGDCGLEMKVIQTKSIICCPQCGKCLVYMDSTNSLVSYGDEVEFTNFSYKRLNHFNEKLLQMQAKEVFEIGEDVVRAVMKELYNRRTDVQDINCKLVREVLKTLKLRKTYEHVSQITMRITGVVPPRLTPEMEEMCRLCFIAIQPAFEEHCPSERKNFLSYYYVLYRLFEMFGLDQLLPNFVLLKGRDKLIKQDQIWKKICHSLDWEFDAMNSLW